MAIWNIEIIIEGTGNYLNFDYETDHNDEFRIFSEIENIISIVPTLVEPEEEEQIHVDTGPSFRYTRNKDQRPRGEVNGSKN